MHARCSADKRHRVFAFPFAVAALFLLPLSAGAAVLSLDPDKGSFGPGDTFVLTIRLDPALDECVNAADVRLRYPAELLKASVVSRGESYFTLWTEEPSIDHALGRITFSGGIPGGYCGRIQGDPGRTDVLARVVFSVPGTMIGSEAPVGDVPFAISFGDGTQVLLNDGLGSAAALQLHGGQYTRSSEAQGITNEWLDIVRADTLPPDPFSATVHKDAQMFEGKYFIIFATVDKQSGIDHYEVIEEDPLRPGFVRGKADAANPRRATSPYLLTDQDRKSKIIVRAIDHGGNVAEAVISPESGATQDANTSRYSSLYILIIVAALALVAFAGFIWRKRSIARDEEVASDEHQSNGL